MAADLESLCKEGRQLFRHGKYAESIHAFEQVLKADPDRSDVHDAIEVVSIFVEVEVAVPDLRPAVR